MISFRVFAEEPPTPTCGEMWRRKEQEVCVNGKNIMPVIDELVNGTYYVKWSGT